MFRSNLLVRAAGRGLALLLLVTTFVGTMPAPSERQAAVDAAPVATVDGDGVAARIVCLTCIAAVLAASGTGSIIAVTTTLSAYNPAVIAACLYACAAWNS